MADDGINDFDVAKVEHQSCWSADCVKVKLEELLDAMVRRSLAIDSAVGLTPSRRSQTSRTDRSGYHTLRGPFKTRPPLNTAVVLPHFKQCGDIGLSGKM